MLTKTDREALAALVERAIAERKKTAADLGTATNTKFLEELLRKLGTSAGAAE